MNILITHKTLTLGGPQMVAIRLANAFAKRHRVWFYLQFPNMVNDGYLRLLRPDVPVLHFDPPPLVNRIVFVLDGWLRRAGCRESLYARMNERTMRRLIRRHRIDVVNTHSQYSDERAALALRGSKHVKLLVTNHEHYSDISPGSAPPDLLRSVSLVCSRADAMVYFNEASLKVIRQLPGQPAFPIRKIYSGIDVATVAPRCAGAEPDRPQLPCTAGRITFGMIANGLRDKGWDEVIQSFKELAAENPSFETRLILVGAGPHLDAIRRRERHRDIEFAGFTSAPLDWVRRFDVGILPSKYELLPTFVVECFAYGRPVISTDVGEVRAMMDVKGELAGFLVGKDANGLADVRQLKAAMLSYLSDRSLLERQTALASQAFKKFAMDSCMEEYESLIAVIQGRSSR